MGLAEEARQRFVRNQERRIDYWVARPNIGLAIGRAARIATWGDGQPAPQAVAACDVDVTAEWHDQSVVVTFDGDELELLIRLIGDLDRNAEAIQEDLEVYVVMLCQRCGRKAPHGPPFRDGEVEFGRVLLVGTPADGHPCVPPAEGHGG